MQLCEQFGKRLARGLILASGLVCPVPAVALGAAPTPASNTMKMTCPRTRICGAVLKTPISALSVVATPITPPAPSGGGGGGGSTGQPTPVLGAAPRPAQGKLSETLDRGQPLVCAGYQAVDPNWFSFQLTGQSSAAAYQLTDTVRNTTPRRVRFCLNFPHTFRTLSGRPSRGRRSPDGSRGYIGLLPPCSKVTAANGASGPCIDRITTTRDANSTTGIDTVLRVFIPAGSSDPWGRV